MISKERLETGEISARGRKMIGRHRGFTRVLVFILICGFTCCFLWNCSGTGKASSLFTFWRSDERNSGPDEKEIASFISTVRPPQGNADAHYNLARYLVERGKYKEALAEFNKVAAIRPGSARAYNGLGVCYDNLGDFRRAMEAYRTALSIDPSLDFVYNNIGCCLTLQKKYDEAVDAFKKAMVLNDQNPRYHTNLGTAYALAGNHDLAAREFELGGAKPVAESAAARTQDQPTNFQASANDEKREIASTLQGTADPLSASGRIELLNGNGVNGMARRMRAYLEERGFKVVRCANADNFDYLQTSLYYRKEGLEAAQQLLTRIPDIKNVKEVKRLERNDSTIKIVMGRDLKPFKNELEGER